ncbi:ulp1 protease family, C-terminal catalytic domain-containing protein [Tanacetum coccineum]
MLSQPAVRCDPRIHHQLDPFLVFGGSVGGAGTTFIDDVTGEQYVERADANVVVMILKTSSFYVEQGGQVSLSSNMIYDDKSDEFAGANLVKDSKALIRPKRTQEALSRRDGAKQWFLKKDPTKFFANGVNLNAYGRIKRPREFFTGWRIRGGIQRVVMFTVRGAGHAVPSYQPERPMVMISAFIQRNPIVLAQDELPSAGVGQSAAMYCGSRIGIVRALARIGEDSGRIEKDERGVEGDILYLVQTGISIRFVRYDGVLMSWFFNSDGLPKDEKNYKKSSKGNEVLQPKRSPNTKSSVRRLPKEVAKEKGQVKLKVALVELNVGKRKRLVEDKEVEDERDSDVEGSDGESDSDEEVEADVEGNESKEDNESEEEKETKVSKESDDSKPGVKDVKMKGVKGNKTVDVSNAKKRMHVSDSSSEEDKVSKPKNVSKKNKQVKDVKKRKHVSDSSSSYDDFSSSEEEKVLKPKKVIKKKKQVKVESSSSEDEKPLKNKKRSKHVKDVKKKKKKPQTAEQIKKIEYLSDLPCLRSRTVPSSLFASIRDSQVDMESFLSDIGFSSLHNISIDTLPQRFARFVVRAFSASSYEFKLEKGIICVTLEKVHEILRVPLGGTSIFDLPKRPLDYPFVNEWFKQFDPKPLKEIRACGIAKKLILTKTVDFMFKVNFLMLFSNVMGIADTMKKSSKGNEVLQPKTSRNTKSSVRRISKEVVKPKGDPVKSNVDKRKRLVEDKEVEADVEGNENEEADESEKDNESEEAEEIEEDKESEVAEEVVKDVKTKVVKGKKKVVLSKSKKRNEEVEANVEGNESEADESEKDNEGEKSEESEADKESEVVEEVVKDVKTKVVKVDESEEDNESEKSEESEADKESEVAEEAKKRKYVSDSSEEEKVSKPKKVYKKKKQVFEYSSSYKDEKPLKIKKKHFAIRRTEPSFVCLLTILRDSKFVTRDSFMLIIGFSSCNNVYIDTLPQRFARFVVRAFSASSYEFKLEKGIIRVTPEKVHEILGVPLGGNSIFDLPEIPLDDPFVKEWFKQFDPKPLNKIRACDIAEKLVLTKTVDFMFKVNFLMLFANVMGTTDTMKAIVNLTVLRRFMKIQTLRELIGVGSYTNVFKAVLNRILLVAFTLLLYLDSTKFDQFLVIHQRPAIRNWTTTAMNQRQELEIQEQRFCSMIEEKISMISAEKIALEDLLKKANAEFPNDEKVIELCEKYRRLFKESVFVEDFQAHIDDFDNNDDDGGGKNDDHGSDNVGKKKESVAKDVVNAEKDGVNAEKDGVNAIQQGEADVNEEPEDMLEEETLTHWIEKNIDWVGRFVCVASGCQPISVVCPQTPQRVVTRSSPNKRIIKPSTYMTSPYMNKRTKVTSLIKRLEFVLGNSLFAMQGDKYETVFQTRSGHDLSSVRLNIKTLAPRLWIDANVIDCWVAILNHEELVRGCSSSRRHFFPTGCITKAIIEGTIDEEQQWKVFSDEISAQFEHDVSSISLSEVDLKKFFARHLKKYNHPKHIYVAKLKHRIPKLKWSTTKNYSDCGVFTMIHLEHYFGKPVGQWDFGLCEESDEQVSMLRRMRFKIATKILLHEFNVHAEKMFC